MANSSSDDSAACSQDTEPNPFVAFRRYADERFSTLLQSFIGLPSLSGGPRHGRWLDVEEQRRAYVSVPSQRTRPEMRNAAAPESWEDRRRREDNEAGETVEVPVRRCYDDDRGAAGPLTTATDSTTTSFPTLVGSGVSSHIGHDFLFTMPTIHPFDSFPASVASTLSRWPLDYLLSSPYSPLHLEKQDLDRQHGTWRAAFEDLLVADQGKDLPPRREGHDGPAGQWVMDVLRRSDGSSSPVTASEEGARCGGEETRRRARAIREATAKTPDAEEGSGPATELDIYARFLGSRSGPVLLPFPASPSASVSTSTSHIPPTAPATTRAQNADGANNGEKITATITTTERSTNPDGSMVTKVLLKKRFADGREVCTESVHRSDSSPFSSSTTPSASLVSSNEGSRMRAREDPGKGWFWSS